jgi:hypothetical protein
MTDTKDSEKKTDEERFIETLRRLHKTPPKPNKMKEDKRAKKE